MTFIPWSVIDPHPNKGALINQQIVGTYNNKPVYKSDLIKHFALQTDANGKSLYPAATEEFLNSNECNNFIEDVRTSMRTN